MTDNLDILSFDDLPDSRPTIETGERQLRLVNPKAKTSKEGNPYVNYDAVVINGPDAGYRIFGAFFSLSKDNAWKFKDSMKRVGFVIPKGKTVAEAAKYFEDNANGLQFVGIVGKEPAQEKNADGEYVDVEGAFRNNVGRWLGPVA